MKKTILSILLALMICSCGARKSDKSRLDEVQKTEITDNSGKVQKEESNIRENSTIKVDDKNKIKTTETKYKPVDPTKEASVTTPDGKKHNLNNAEIVIKETEQQNNTKTDNSTNSEQFHKSEVSELSEFKAKADVKKASEVIKIDREAWSIWNWLWLLVPIGLIVIVWKNKTKIASWFAGIWWV
jgi:hypothetical protein